MDQLTFAYGTEPILSDVTLRIPAGQSVALVGPSGAGKSTFVNLVPRFFDPQSGSIQVDGYDLRTVKQVDLRANIALVSQEPVLFNETIAENIRLGRPAASLPTRLTGSPRHRPPAPSATALCPTHRLPRRSGPGSVGAQPPVSAPAIG